MAKKGIVLMNLGSPDSTEIKDIKKYLMQFLMDKRVIDYPYLIRLLLVGGIIVPFRSPKTAEAYKEVWTKDGSPLIVFSKQLQEALQANINEPVVLAMRYGNPSMQYAFDKLLNENPDLEEVIAIPLYPHYAMSSYETAVEHAKTVHQNNKYSFSLSFVKPFYDDSAYITALSESIKPYLAEEYDQVLFSYHGLPQRHMSKADPTHKHCMKVENCCEVASVAHSTCYRHQCWTTTQLLARELNIPKEKLGFSFQSRLGKEEWLKPYTAVRLEELPKEGVKKLVILCPAFVSDCLETLEEIAGEGREAFLHAGGEKCTVVPCLNLHPLWVKALVTWVNSIVSGNKEMLLN